MAVTIEGILTEAVQAGASDVHIAAGAQPKMRVDGKLFTMSCPKLLQEDTLALFVSIMTETQRRLFEEQGEYDMAFGVRSLGRFRVNAYKQRGSVALAVRLTGPEIPTPESLGIPEQVMELCEKKQGLVLAAGPSGSGRSAMLAAVIDRINSMQETHIITLENPIEYIHSHKRSIVSQREVGLDCISYASALRAALREDPDVILVGELRDAETIDAAITAAEAGHLVLSFIHTSEAADVVACLTGAFPASRQEQIRRRLANVLEMIVSRKFSRDKPEDKRTPVYEIMQVTGPVRDLIRSGRLECLPDWEETEGKR